MRCLESRARHHQQEQFEIVRNAQLNDSLEYRQLQKFRCRLEQQQGLCEWREGTFCVLTFALVFEQFVHEQSARFTASARLVTGSPKVPWVECEYIGGIMSPEMIVHGCGAVCMACGTE